jgi:uridine kinase
MWLAHFNPYHDKLGRFDKVPFSVSLRREVDKRIDSDTSSFERPHTDYNLNKWGKSKDTNILFVTGVSGSGKSTLARTMASKNNADIINIDLYTFKTTKGFIPGMSKNFNKYLDTHYPNWQRMQKEAYEVLTKNDRRLKKKAGEWFDTFEEALLGYGREQYGKQKVVAEGVQILDETLFYNNKQALRDKPLIVMDTSAVDSLLSRVKRDNSILDKQFEPERMRQIENWLRDQELLKKTMDEID